MPLAGKEIDFNRIAELIRDEQPDIAFIEKVHAMPKQGVSSTFTFGMGYGGVLGVLAALEIPTNLVLPQAWKKEILEGTAKDKDAAIAYCRRRWPQVSLILPRCRKPHDGMADALCIMEYGLTKTHN